MVMGKVKGPGAICGNYISAKRANYVTYSTISLIKEAAERLEEGSNKQIIINLTHVIQAHAKAAYHNTVKDSKRKKSPLTQFEREGTIIAEQANKVHDDIVDDAIKDHYKELSIHDQRINNNKRLCDENKKLTDERYNKYLDSIVSLLTRVDYIAAGLIKTSNDKDEIRCELDSDIASTKRLYGMYNNMNDRLYVLENALKQQGIML